jgi:hypothetical protein
VPDPRALTVNTGCSGRKLTDRASEQLPGTSVTVLTLYRVKTRCTCDDLGCHLLHVSMT